MDLQLGQSIIDGAGCSTETEDETSSISLTQPLCPSLSDSDLLLNNGMDLEEFTHSRLTCLDRDTSVLSDMAGIGRRARGTILMMQGCLRVFLEDLMRKSLENMPKKRRVVTKRDVEKAIAKIPKHLLDLERYRRQKAKFIQHRNTYLAMHMFRPKTPPPPITREDEMCLSSPPLSPVLNPDGTWNDFCGRLRTDTPPAYVKSRPIESHQVSA